MIICLCTKWTVTWIHWGRGILTLWRTVVQLTSLVVHGGKHFSHTVITCRSYSRKSGGWVSTGSTEKSVCLKYSILSYIDQHVGLGSAEIFMADWKRFKESGNSLYWRLYPCCCTALCMLLVHSLTHSLTQSHTHSLTHPLYYVCNVTLEYQKLVSLNIVRH